MITGLNRLDRDDDPAAGHGDDAVQEDGQGHAVRRLQPDHRHPEDPRALPGRDLKLDELITRTYTLDEVNEGYDDLLGGKNVRGVMVRRAA